MRTGFPIVALLFGLALLPNAATATAQDQSVPDAPRPQKPPPPKKDAKPDSNTPEAPAAPRSTADDNPFPDAVSRDAAKQAATPQQKDKPATADDNPFPDAVSRDAAKQAAQQQEKPSGQKSTADDNPFPESVSRDAAKQAGNDSSQPASTVPQHPGESSSQAPALSAPAAPPQPNPGLAVKDNKVGDLYLKRGNFQGALQRYQEATAVDPTNVDSIFGLAETQKAMGKTADAAKNYQLYLDIVPNGPKSKEALKALKTLEPGK